MKKIIAILAFTLFFSHNLSAGVTTGYKLGEGTLKITKNTADILEFYFSGGKRGFYAEKQKAPWKPGLIAISVDGAHSSFFRHPLSVNQIDSKHYAGMAISDCQKKSGKECFLFANGYKIVWDNGSSKKKRRFKSKDIRAGKTIALLTDLGFYDGASSNEIKDDKNSNSDDDIVKKLNNLKELLDSGAITQDEFNKAKKKLLN